MATFLVAKPGTSRADLEVYWDNPEDRMRFISILCLARQRVTSKATLDMIADLLKELVSDD